MINNEYINNNLCFITHNEFNRFQANILLQFQKMSNIIKQQQLQIKQIQQSKKRQTQSISQNNQNKQLQYQYQQLKIKIAKLEQSIKNLQSKLNQQIEDQNQSHIKSYKLPQPSFYLNQTTSKISLESQCMSDSIQIQSVNDSSIKCKIDIRKTKQTQSLQDDDDQQIQCVWNYSQKNELNILNNSNHHHNPHNKQFIINQKYQYIDITKINGNGFLTKSYNFIHKDIIPLRKISSYKIKKIKIRDIFLIGIGTINIFGIQNAFRNKDSLAYASNGDIWINGDSKKIGKYLNFNQQIQIIIDRINGKVIWKLQGQQITKINIPKHIIQKQLYLIIMMFNKDDNLRLYNLN